MAVIGNAYITVHAITTGFQRDVNNSLNGIQRQFASSGNNAGNAFSRAFSRSSPFSNFQKEAMAANDALSSMIRTGYAVGPAISVAAGAISSLVSGLFALGAQVASAAPALIVLPGLLAAIGQAAIFAKTAFSGVGDAMKELSKKKGGGQDKQKKIADAEKNLARVLENARESLVRADKRLTEAEDRLTEARKEAAESLQQLNFDAEDAAISEKRAAIELEKARETLARVQDMPPNSRARREAELAYAEADLNLRRAKDRNSDLTKETEEANAKGVEGSEQVASATEALQEAKDAQAKAELDALRAITEAEERLAEARKGGSGAGGGGESAFDKLSDAAKKFVLYLMSIKDVFKELKDAAGVDLFPKLQVAIQTLIDKLLPVLIPMAKATGGALGKAAVEFANIVTSADNLKNIDTIGKNNTKVIGKLGRVVGNLVSTFGSLLASAGPLIDRFTEWAVKLTDTWRETSETKNKTGQLRDTFKRAGDVAAQLGRILKNIWKAIKRIGGEASGPGSGGEKLLNTFEESTKRFEEFADKLSKNGRLKEFFNGVADNTIEISKLVVNFAKEFLKLGENKAIGETAKKLSPLAGIIGTVMDTLQDAGPYLGELVEQIGLFTKNFTETKSIETFFGILTMAMEKLNAFFGNELVQKILLFVAPIMGAVKAFGLIMSVGGFFFKAFAGYFVKLFSLVSKVIGAFQFIGMLFGGGGLLGLGVVAAIAAIAGAIYLMWTNSEDLRKAIGELVAAVWDNLVAAFNEIKGAIEDVLGEFGGAGDAMGSFGDVMGRVGDFIAKYIVPVFRDYLVSGIKVLKLAIKGIIYTIGGIIKIFQAVWDFVQGIFALLKGDMDGVKKHFGRAWEAIKDAVKFFLKAIGNFFQAYWEYVFLKLRKFLHLFTFIWDAAKWIFQNVWDIIKNLFSVVWDGILLAIEGIKWVWEKIWGGIKAYFSLVWEGIKLAFSLVWDFIKISIESVKVVWETVWGAVTGFFSIVWEGIKVAFSLVWDFVKLEIEGIVNIFKMAWEGAKLAFETVWDLFKAAFFLVWDAIKLAIDGFTAVFKGVWDGLKAIYQPVVDALSTAWDTLTGGMETAINGVLTVFTTVFDTIKGIVDTIWDGMVGGFKLVVNGVIAAIESGVNFLIDAANAVIEYIPFVDYIDHITLPRLASGGVVAPGALPSVGRLATGGFIPGSNRGVMANIAEEGKAEAVLPLTNPKIMGMLADAIMTRAGTANGGGIVMNVYPSQGMDEVAIANIASRQMAFQLRKGGV